MHELIRRLLPLRPKTPVRIQAETIIPIMRGVRVFAIRLCPEISYFWIVYILWFGGAGKLAQKAGGAVLDAFNALKWFVLVGWAIYPIGYMIGTDGWYDFVDALGWNMEVVYNVGDAINKIGFGLVIYNLAVTDK